MGKNNSINSLSKVIGSVVIHRLLAKHTHKTESISYLKNEIKEYASNALEKSQEFNWNEEDKLKIMEESAKNVKRIKEIKYPDVSMLDSEIESEVSNFMDELNI